VRWDWGQAVTTPNDTFPLDRAHSSLDRRPRNRRDWYRPREYDSAPRTSQFGRPVWTERSAVEIADHRHCRLLRAHPCGHAAAPPSRVMNSRRLSRPIRIRSHQPRLDRSISNSRRSVSGEVRSTSVSGNNPGSQAFPGGATTGLMHRNKRTRYRSCDDLFQ